MVSTTLLYPTNATLNGRLKAFADAHVDLSPEDTALGRDLAAFVQDAFCASANTANNAHLPHVYSSESYLAGSLGRRTQAQPLDDIDVFLVFNAGGTSMTKGGIREPVEMFGTEPNPLLSALYASPPWISSARVLEAFLPVAQGFVDRFNSVTDAGVGAKQRTLFIRFGHINVDVVLVELGRAAHGLDKYYLPDGGGMWRASNPKEDQRRLSEMNGSQGGNLLALIRLIKWWNKAHNAGRLKGIHIEVMVENATRGWLTTSTFSALRLIFPALIAAVGVPCPDPTGLGPDLDQRLSAQDRSDSIEALTAAWNAVLTAGRFADAGRTYEAVAAMQPVFPI
ncbi:MAG: hypothetical protein AB7G21_14280 [Dehalococcoidia bacterium]